MTARSFHPSVLLLKSASPGEVILSHSDGDLDFLPPASDDRGSVPDLENEFQLADQSQSGQKD